MRAARCCTVLLVALGLAGADDSSTRRPNVVILLADDLGWKDIGCYGGPVKTPALDGLAERGVRFESFYSGAAVCSPSRATLLTGRHHIRAGVYRWIHDHDQNSHLLEREVTLAEILRPYRYSTAHFGKWHLGLERRFLGSESRRFGSQLELVERSVYSAGRFRTARPIE